MRSSRLVLNTVVGAIEIEVHETQAPQTARFVRQVVEAGHFDGAAFSRSTTLGVDGRHRLIQGGPLAPLFTATADPIPHIEMLDTIESTDQTGLAHRCGTVSLARDLMTSGRVLPEVFICLDDYPELDFGGRNEPDGQGFPAFGAVTAGLDVVTAIATQERSGASPVELLAGEILNEPVRIVNATISDPTTESSN